MSDGNFNRQLLPKTELSSGLRAGKAQMRQKAEQAFDEVINHFILDENELEKTLHGTPKTIKLSITLFITLLKTF